MNEYRNVTDSDTQKVKTILKYPGAKNRIADWIVSFVPEHSVYLEPFFGSGAVFFHKKKARIETINDLDNNVYIFFKVLRNEPEELIRRLYYTPYSRTEYEKAFEPTTDEIEIARRFSIKCWQGFGCSNVYKTDSVQTNRGAARKLRNIGENCPNDSRERKRYGSTMIYRNEPGKVTNAKM